MGKQAKVGYRTDKNRGKSNEITAVPKLLDMLDVKSCIITADAISCQKDITKKITVKKADYVLGLKGNQQTFHEDVKLYFDNTISEQKTIAKEKGHVSNNLQSLHESIEALKTVCIGF